MSATAASALPDSMATSTSELAQAAIFFPEGLVGCPDWQLFVQVVDSEEDLPVAILQCIDHAEVQFLVTDPTLIDPEYAVQLSSAQRAKLGLVPGTEPVVYCTLTVRADGCISANLLGPLVVDPSTRRALQLVLADSKYSTQHPVASMPTAKVES
jgi:flagellar assembly factor FliW